MISKPFLSDVAFHIRGGFAKTLWIMWSDVRGTDRNSMVTGVASTTPADGVVRGVGLESRCTCEAEMHEQQS
jgi:hypothetical protein